MRVARSRSWRRFPGWRNRDTVARWKELFADPRFPLPDTVIPSGAVDDETTEEALGKGVTPLDNKD